MCDGVRAGSERITSHSDLTCQYYGTHLCLIMVEMLGGFSYIPYFSQNKVTNIYSVSCYCKDTQLDYSNVFDKNARALGFLHFLCLQGMSKTIGPHLCAFQISPL